MSLQEPCTFTLSSFSHVHSSKFLLCIMCLFPSCLVPPHRCLQLFSSICHYHVVLHNKGTAMAAMVQKLFKKRYIILIIFRFSANCFLPYIFDFGQEFPSRWIFIFYSATYSIGNNIHSPGGITVAQEVEWLLGNWKVPINSVSLCSL